MTLSGIVNAYIRDHRESMRSEMRCFQTEPNLRTAIRKAALCLRPNDKHPQQWNKGHSPMAPFQGGPRRKRAAATAKYEKVATGF